MKKPFLTVLTILGYVALWWILDWLALNRTEGIVIASGWFFWLCQDWSSRTRLQRVLAELEAVKDGLKEARADIHVNETLLEIGLGDAPTLESLATRALKEGDPTALMRYLTR